MPRIIEDCTGLVGECVLVIFREYCLDETIPTDQTEWPTLSGSVSLVGVDGCPQDSNGGFILTGINGLIETFTHSPEGASDWTVVTIGDCQYLAARTCNLPSNLDSGDTIGPTRHIEPEGTRYQLNLTVDGTKKISASFEIDAGIDYSAEYLDGCIPVSIVMVDGDGNPTENSDVFSERVCNTDCFIDLTATVTDHETRIAALEAVSTGEFVTSVAVGLPDPSGNVEVTYTTNLGNTTSAGTVPEPADIYVTGITSADVTNPDGSVTTTFTVALSDGTTTPFAYDHIASDVPSGIVLDPAAGTVTVSYMRPDGTTYDLSDTVAPFADTDTTNATFTIDNATGLVTLTDSAGNDLSVTVPLTDDTNTTNSALDFDPATSVLTITDSDGNTVSETVDSGSTSAISGPTINGAGDSVYTHDDGDGNTVDIVIPAGAANSVSSVSGPVINGTGASVYTHDDGDGNTTDIVVPAAGGGGSTSSITGPVVNGDGANVFTHDDGDGNTADIVVPENTFAEFVDNADGSVTFTSADGTETCEVSTEQITLCIGDTPGEAVHTQRVTDLKTGVETDYLFSASLLNVNAFAGSLTVDDTLGVGAANVLSILPPITIPTFGRATLGGIVRVGMQLNADANPSGAPGENIDIRYRINGGNWLTMAPVTSMSLALLGINGATGSNLTNQEIVVTGSDDIPNMPSGATLEFGINATTAFDPGESFQLQSILGSFEYIDLNCEAI